MYPVLIVHSGHTKEYAYKISKKYKCVEFLEVTHPPTIDILQKSTYADKIIGIGGGSVLDTAKILARNKRCIAMPTTASGAAVTPFATVWGKKKISIETQKPILAIDSNMPIELSYRVKRSTISDALSHTIESFWSANATVKSKKYSKKAFHLIDKYLKVADIRTLIEIGIYAGRAIAITKTNIVHAASYPISIEYNIDHGTACGMLLPYFVGYIDYKELPKMFNLKTNSEVANFLMSLFIFHKINNLDARLVAEKALEYPKIKDGPKSASKDNLIRILRNLKQ